MYVQHTLAKIIQYLKLYKMSIEFARANDVSSSKINLYETRRKSSAINNKYTVANARTREKTWPRFICGT